MRYLTSKSKLGCVLFAIKSMSTFKRKYSKTIFIGCILEGNTFITGTKIQSHREKNCIELVSMRSW